jgi:hypothetical protein
LGSLSNVSTFIEVRMIFFRLILLIVLFASESIAADNPQRKIADNYVAVFEFETEGVDKSVSRPITESIRREIVKSGKYELIDRSDMNRTFGDKKFQSSGCISGKCIVEAGKLLGVDKIVTGSVSKLGNTYFLSLQLANAKSGKIEESSEDKCKGEVDDLIPASNRLVKKLLGEKNVSEVIIIQPGINTKQLINTSKPSYFTSRNALIDQFKIKYENFCTRKLLFCFSEIVNVNKDGFDIKTGTPVKWNFDWVPKRVKNIVSFKSDNLIGLSDKRDEGIVEFTNENDAIEFYTMLNAIKDSY